MSVWPQGGGEGQRRRWRGFREEEPPPSHQTPREEKGHPVFGCGTPEGGGEGGAADPIGPREEERAGRREWKAAGQGGGSAPPRLDRGLIGRRGPVRDYLP